MAELHDDDDQLYLVEPDHLAILDARSGEVLSQSTLDKAPSAGPSVQNPLPFPDRVIVSTCATTLGETISSV